MEVPRTSTHWMGLKTIHLELLGGMVCVVFVWFGEARLQQVRQPAKRMVSSWHSTGPRIQSLRGLFEVSMYCVKGYDLIVVESDFVAVKHEHSVFWAPYGFEIFESKPGGPNPGKLTMFDSLFGSQLGGGHR